MSEVIFISIYLFYLRVAKNYKIKLNAINIFY